MELKRIVGIPERVVGLLLIVPYGIETKNIRLSSLTTILLIVPYGIETEGRYLLLDAYMSFNRTLWN